MVEHKCPKCGRLLQTGDKVEALIVTEYVALKSKVAYALQRPTDCLSINHVNCEEPS